MYNPLIYGRPFSFLFFFFFFIQLFIFTVSYNYIIIYSYHYSIINTIDAHFFRAGDMTHLVESRLDANRNCTTQIRKE